MLFLTCTKTFEITSFLTYICGRRRVNFFSVTITEVLMVQFYMIYLNRYKMVCTVNMTLIVLFHLTEDKICMFKFSIKFLKIGFHQNITMSRKAQLLFPLGTESHKIKFSHENHIIPKDKHFLTFHTNVMSIDYSNTDNIITKTFYLH